MKIHDFKWLANRVQLINTQRIGMLRIRTSQIGRYLQDTDTSLLQLVQGGKNPAEGRFGKLHFLVF